MSEGEPGPQPDHFNNPEETPEVSPERLQKWHELEQKLDAVTDGLGKPLDAGIRETVLAF